jgi:1-deoxy-D-xylulose-5-phosphate synthase
MDSEYRNIFMGRAEVLREGKDLLIVALGSMVSPAMEAAETLESEGCSACVVNCRFVKPLDERIAELASSTGRVLVVEENIRSGGLGGAVIEMLNDLGVGGVSLRRLGLPDRFIEHGPLPLLREKEGLDPAGILKEARGLCSQK